MEKVKVTSMVGHKVNVSSPELRFNRTWATQGAVVSIDRETLEELMYDTGFKNMIETGILYIEDMKVKKDLGIEPEDATEPVNVIKLTDKEKKIYLTELSLAGFKDKVKKLSQNQLFELCDYAVDNKIMNFDKCEVLKKACGRDVLKAITLVEANEEAIKEAKKEA